MKSLVLSFSFFLCAFLLTTNSFAQMPVGWWNFDNSANITAAVPGYGGDLVLTGTQEAVAGPTSGNGATRIGVGSYYTTTHGIDPNGGGTKVNQYSLMFDFRVEQAIGMWHNFFQTDPVVGANDGEYFIRSTTGALGTLDIAYTTPFVVSANTWYRLILTVENGSFFKAYIDGQFIFDHNIKAVDDARYSLAPVLHLFGDDDGDDGLIDVAEVAIWNYALTEAEVTALGAAGTVLPVELTSFSASQINGIVNLQWSTATELNNNGFEIQRSLLNSDWSTLGFIKGNGTTTTPQYYSYSDKPASTGKYLYRLKQIDFNGSFAYSEVVEVQIVPSEYKLYNNYPNPFNPSTNISYSLPVDAQVTLNVYSAIGELVGELINERQSAGFHDFNFNANNLTSGIYFAELKANESIQRIKMMLIK